MPFQTILQEPENWGQESEKESELKKVDIFYDVVFLSFFQQEGKEFIEMATVMKQCTHGQV